MEIVAKVNDNHLHVCNLNPYRPETIQEAALLFDGDFVTIVTDIHAQGQPYNAFAFTADELRQIADMIETGKTP